MHTTIPLFNAAKEIFELSPRLRAIQLDERIKLADLLALIGHILDDTKNKYRMGEVTTVKSQQIILLSEELYFRLALSIGAAHAQLLSRKLRDGFCKMQHQGVKVTPEQWLMLESTVGYLLEASSELGMSKAGND